MTQKVMYKNALRSKKLIRNAFADIIEKKGDFNKITITEVVERAEINRGTFYAHYGNIYDIIVEIENEISQKLLEIVSKFCNNNLTTSTLPFLKEIEVFVKENEVFYRKLLKVQIKKQNLNHIKQIMDDFMQHDESITRLFRDHNDLIMQVGFFTSGIVGMYYDYLTTQPIIPIEYITKNISIIMDTYFEAALVKIAEREGKPYVNN